MNRIVEPELLDRLPPDDPRAIASRRDLRRINFLMRNHEMVARALLKHWNTEHYSAGEGRGQDDATLRDPVRIIEIGAGDGNFMLNVAKKISSHRPNVTVTLLDLQKNVSIETIQAFENLGCRVEPVVADVFDWPQIPAEIVIANLFLHHFENHRLKALLVEIAKRAGLFVAVEPRRAPWPLFWSRMLWGIGCNSVTRHDAVVSVRAGFRDRELSELWPDQNGWTLLERRSGLFSHLFIARRNQTGRTV